MNKNMWLKVEKKNGTHFVHVYMSWYKGIIKPMEIGETLNILMYKHDHIYVKQPVINLLWCFNNKVHSCQQFSIKVLHKKYTIYSI